MGEASRRWVKVWHELIGDHQFQDQPLEQLGRYYNLLVYTSAYGDNGCLKINAPARTLVTLLQCENYDDLYNNISKLRNVQVAKNDNAEFSVTFSRWSKYQKDSTGYERVKRHRKRQSVTPQEEEKEKEEDKDKEKKKKKVSTANMPEDEWIALLEGNAAYQGIDIRKLKAKMEAWCVTNGKQPTRKRLLNWLNREDKPLQTEPKAQGATHGNKHTGLGNKDYNAGDF